MRCLPTPISVARHQKPPVESNTAKPASKPCSNGRRRHRARPEDLIRTATILTALSIVDAFHRWVLPRASVAQLVVAGGGGAHNPLFITGATVGRLWPNVEILLSDALGVPTSAKEAFAFALLANETMHGRAANLPGATGAAYPAILGKICAIHPRGRRRARKKHLRRALRKK